MVQKRAAALSGNWIGWHMARDWKVVCLKVRRNEMKTSLCREGGKGHKALPAFWGKVK